MANPSGRFGPIRHRAGPRWRKLTSSRRRRSARRARSCPDASSLPRCRRGRSCARVRVSSSMDNCGPVVRIAVHPGDRVLKSNPGPRVPERAITPGRRQPPPSQRNPRSRRQVSISDTCARARHAAHRGEHDRRHRRDRGGGRRYCRRPWVPGSRIPRPRPFGRPRCRSRRVGTCTSTTTPSRRTRSRPTTVTPTAPGGR